MATVNELLESSKEVLSDCAVDNGAIVAANCDREDYPKNVAHYRKVWPRDAAYICVAADLLELYDIPDKYFKWMWERMERFQETGEMYNGYRTNGEILGNASPAGKFKADRKFMKYTETLRYFHTQMQIDQYGATLWAMHHHWKRAEHFNDKMVKVLVNKLCEMWKRDHFNRICVDLWEERSTVPKYKNVFTYTLAMSIRGLECADEMLGLPSGARQVLAEMKAAFSEAYDEKKGRFKRSYRPNKTIFWWRNKKDLTPDASLLAVSWPANLVDELDGRMVSTVRSLEANSLYNGRGVMRYPGDMYSGKWVNMWYDKDGAGAWPLLNFWLAIYYARAGNRKLAKKYFNWVLERADKYLPEQIFREPGRQSIKPLAWSHAMFVIAARELDYF